MINSGEKKVGTRVGSEAKSKYACKKVTMRVPVDMVDVIQKKKNRAEI